MNKLITYILVLLCAACVYVTVVCLHQLSVYDAKLIGLNNLINHQDEQINTLNQEDLVQIRIQDGMQKEIRNLNDRIRIQDAIIAEARARKKK
jgi:hypothetical protein